MTFHVGQKVVCVDDADQSVLGFRAVLSGKIYTVRWVGVDGHPGHPNPFRRKEIVSIKLDEIVRRGGPPIDDDMPFRASRFRPVIERKTDISIFTEMLMPMPKVREREDIGT